MALRSQGVLLFIFLFLFFWMYLGRPTFAEEGLTSTKALYTLAAMLPNMALFCFLLLRRRWAPTVGAVLSFLVLLTTLSADKPALLPAFLWIVTFLGCIFAIRSDIDGAVLALKKFGRIWHGGLKPLVALGFGLLILASPILLLHFAISNGQGRGDYVGVAPEGSVEQRRAWAKKEMFDYFKLTEQWVRKSSLIQNDIGPIIDVAPIGSPNRFVAGGFTDGSHCRMNLQVIGKKGEGILYLPEVNVNNMYDLYGISEWSTWTFDGETQVIDHTGMSWAESSGHQELLEQIQNLESKGDHEGVVMVCRLLSGAMFDADASENSESQSRFFHSKQMFIDAPFKHRCELLSTFGNSLNEIGEHEEAVNIYIQIAALALCEFDYNNHDPNNRSARGNQQLAIANTALISANGIEPSNPEVLKLAGDRTLRKMEFDSGTSVAQTSRFPDDEEKRAVTAAKLGNMFECAKWVVRTSPWIKSQMGNMRMRPKLSYHNLSISEKGYYKSIVSVEAAGSWGRRGELTLRMTELESEVPPLDLFAETPRRPTLNYTISQLKWKQNGDSVRLNAKTLERRQPKSKRKQVAAK